MQGEMIYAYDLNVVSVVDFGHSLEDALSGRVAPPPQGARFDVAFEGAAVGRLSGRVSGVDYVRLRADGRLDLDIRGVIETSDGARIALSASGVGSPRAGEATVDLFENVRLTTSAAAFSWVNARQIWAVGTLRDGKIHVEAYMQ